MRLPDDTKRHAIVGATGSGKTQAALWHLSLRIPDLQDRNPNAIPWVVYNFKKDESIDELPGAHHIPVDQIPVRPGVYVVHPLPHESDAVENQMWAIWERGNTGVYVDEGYMVGRDNRAFRALLTQGRSKHIPMIVLSQRPVWMDRFVFSESEFYQIFRLQHRKDRKLVEEFVPANLEKRLPEFHSYYYDVGANDVTVLKPVPQLEEIYKTFERRLVRKPKTV